MEDTRDMVARLNTLLSKVSVRLIIEENKKAEK